MNPRIQSPEIEILQKRPIFQAKISYRAEESFLTTLVSSCNQLLEVFKKAMILEKSSIWGDVLEIRISNFGRIPPLRKSKY